MRAVSEVRRAEDGASAPLLADSATACICLGERRYAYLLACGRLVDFFRQIGIIKEGKGKEKGKKKVWIYRDKSTGQPKGDATVSYEDPNGAKGAVDWFNGKPFEGKGDPITVSIAQRKANPNYPAGGGGGGYRGGGGGGPVDSQPPHHVRFLVSLLPFSMACRSSSPQFMLIGAQQFIVHYGER